MYNGMLIDSIVMEKSARLFKTKDMFKSIDGGDKVSLTIDIE
jgi:hypothetical protein